MLSSLIACSVCIGRGPDQQDSIAMGWAILFMIVLTLPLLSSIVFFMVRMARTASLHEQN